LIAKECRRWHRYATDETAEFWSNQTCSLGVVSSGSSWVIGDGCGSLCFCSRKPKIEQQLERPRRPAGDTHFINDQIGLDRLAYL
jgi:hypothetical protein